MSTADEIEGQTMTQDEKEQPMKKAQQMSQSGKP